MLCCQDSLQSVNKIAESLGWNTTDIADFLATSRSGDYDMYQAERETKTWSL